MPGTNGMNREPSDKRKFMREKIEKQPLSGRQLAIRVLIMLGLAALCGVVAALGFVFTKRAVSGYMGQESAAETTPVSFTKDDAEATAPADPETDIPAAEARDEEWVKEQVEQALEEHTFTVSDLSAMYDGVRRLAQEIDPGIVTVHSETQQTDWFGNSVESTDQAAGIIIARTPVEILIFTGLSSIPDTEAIEVVFWDGKKAPGTIKQTDEVLGMAVIAVNMSELPEETLKDLVVVELGNSYMSKKGDLIVAVGSPSGVTHSTNYGFVSYISRNVSLTDSTSRFLYTDMEGSAEAGTFILDTEGRMIGWVTDKYTNENSQHMTAVYGISDYKTALERLSNGRSVAYFGVRGQDVTETMIQQGMPAGVYVSNAAVGSPAYEAGIQNGDIITGMGETNVFTVKDMQAQLENMESGQEISVKVRRQSREEYKELEYHVKLRAR